MKIRNSLSLESQMYELFFKNIYLFICKVTASPRFTFTRLDQPHQTLLLIGRPEADDLLYYLAKRILP